MLVDDPNPIQELDIKVVDILIINKELLCEILGSDQYQAFLPCWIKFKHKYHELQANSNITPPIYKHLIALKVDMHNLVTYLY